jgi:D-alanyl-D-alanine carboxypeptidase
MRQAERATAGIEWKRLPRSGPTLRPSAPSNPTTFSALPMNSAYAIQRRLPHALGCLILTAALFSVTACGGGDDARQNLPPGVISKLQAAVDDVPRNNVAPGASITVDHPAYRQWSGAAGVASVAPASALTEQHRLRAGSMLKTAVAIAVLQLVEQSRLSMSSTLDQLVPASIARQVPYAQSITLSMLLNHTSGIPDSHTGDFDSLVSANPKRVWTVTDYLARANSQPRTATPGAVWSYSNTNYILLGEVLAHATGQPWRQVLTERVFKRAGLKRSELPAVGELRCIACARGYDLLDSQLVDMTEVDPSMADAAGGGAWITTTSDLVDLLRALFAGRLFDRPTTLAQMLTHTAAPVPEQLQTGYGLGITRFEVDGQVFLGHLGGTAGFLGFMLYHPATGVATSGFITTRGDLGSLLVPVLETIRSIPRPGAL